MALAGFGPGLAALAPELHQRLIATEAITNPGIVHGPALAALAG
jgi:acyl-coenzyme A thioesterase PaaI-like protein